LGTSYDQYLGTDHRDILLEATSYICVIGKLRDSSPMRVGSNISVIQIHSHKRDVALLRLAFYFNATLTLTIVVKNTLEVLLKPCKLLMWCTLHMISILLKTPILRFSKNWKHS
jgi:hypothetical protein